MTTSRTVEQSARFKVVEFPTALPGACFTCRTHNGPFIDTQLQEDFFGAVILCLGCISEMARLFGFESPDRVNGLESQIQTYIEEIKLQGKDKETLEHENDALRSALVRSSPSDDGGLRNDSEVSDSAESEKGAGVSEDSEPIFEIAD